ncbi:ABC transporter permease [Paracoccus sp. 1_MG-2023]|uniref:ABC transporter permease n=1 Tax=unclassified Paracoccus (in: a-proteobacteria) TaxID=2688777 RepID=UPI001C096A58|nr:MULTISPECIES: ABC transporter permease [unclassified Paracoccus (in: a-proteobacteria)]MBU2957638.1 ABC transporter permease [Paracoccus sp. C2R09]MDO6667515.1 ABC transporter permease [Paracoccus sp. 1_MG-2023]
MSIAETTRPRRLPAFVAKREVERFALLLAWLVLFLTFGALLPDTFLTWRTVSSMLGSQAVLVVLALAILVPLTSGDFDLSAASTLVFAAMFLAVSDVTWGWGIGWSVAAALTIGALIGAVNAFFVLYFRIHSLIVTLGLGTFLNGMTLWISDSRTIAGVSMQLVELVVIKRLLGVPLAFYYGLAVAIVMWWALEYTIAGRKLLFVGRGREVARLNGVSVNRVRGASFVLSGLLAALAGVLYAGMTGSADPTSGLSLLLPAFAAAFLGATAIYPGRFNPIGTLVGVYFLITGITGLTMLGADAFVQSLFYGGALIVAVSLSQLVRRRQPQNFG